MTHKRRLFRRESEGKSQEDAAQHSGTVKHRSRRRGFKLKEWVPWYFIIGVLVGLAAASLVSTLVVNNIP